VLKNQHGWLGERQISFICRACLAQKIVKKKKRRKGKEGKKIASKGRKYALFEGEFLLLVERNIVDPVQEHLLGDDGLIHGNLWFFFFFLSV